MNILVISNSTIVKELIKLVIQENNFNAEFKNSAKNADNINYTTVFLDDTVNNLEEQVEFIKSKLGGELVLISSKKDNEIENIDKILRKPFLPNDIKEILNSCRNEEQKEIKTNILDPEEIAKIKELMGIEETSESIEYEKSYILMLEDKATLKVKNKKAKKLLYELSSLGKKELKKLLKDANITIKIKYKAEDE